MNKMLHRSVGNIIFLLALIFLLVAPVKADEATDRDKMQSIFDQVDSILYGNKTSQTNPTKAPTPKPFNSSTTQTESNSTPAATSKESVATIDISSAFTDLATGMEFVPIKGGCFQKGDSIGDGEPNEKPVHEACARDFAIGKHEVTIGQFRRFIDATGYKTEAERSDSKGCFTIISIDKSEAGYEESLSWKKPIKYQETQDNHPVSCVSWNDAQAFITWMNKKSTGRYRLPTETEWEYAARGGNSGRNYWGNGVDDTCSYANVLDLSKREGLNAPENLRHECNDGFPYIAPVGQFKPNSYGLYDMIGNVAEWTNDNYHKLSYSAKFSKDPWSATQVPIGGGGFAIRGESFFAPRSDTRTSGRAAAARSDGFATIGFRVAASVK